MRKAALAPAEAATWSGPRYRGPFATQPDCEATRSPWESRLDMDPAPCCTYYPSEAPGPTGGIGGPGRYFIFWVRVD